MGVVYRAEDTTTGARVAVKVIRSDPRAALRFGREARLLARLDHPAIVRYVAHGATPEGAPFLAMQWLEGEDLAARLARGPLPLGAAVALARRVADALAALHERGIVHRDLKPSNLFLVDRDPQKATVLDFGIARSADATIAVTAAGAVIGTPGYMAPEQARGELDVDARADVFALGCVLFECVTGRRVFEGEHIMAILVKILLEEPARMSELAGGIPSVLDDVVARMLSKDRGGRPPDGAAVRAELDGAADAVSTALAGTIAPEARPPRRPSSLSHGEQHIVSLVMAATPSGPAPARTESLVAPDGVLPEAAAPVLSGNLPSDPIEVAEPILMARFGARVEHLPDGLLIATLSGGGVATDQAAQAARCALAIRTLFPSAPIVLATGRAQVAGRVAVGPVIDKAVAMLRASQAKTTFGPPSTVVDETTAGLLPSRFRLSTSDLGTILVEEELAADVPRTLLGKPTPFVGRDQELGTLVGLYRHVESDVVARAVVVTGPAGIGKSRLRDELLRELIKLSPPPEVWIGAGDQLASRAPLAALSRALRVAFGLSDGQSQEIARRRIAERVRRHVRDTDAVRISAFLGEVLRVPFDPAGHSELAAARQEPALMAEQTQRALVDFLDAECASGPLVLVLEEAHWADPTTLKVVGVALRELRERPFLVVALARPEFDDAFPGLWAERNALRIALPPLTPRAAERLAARVLAGRGDDERLRRLVRQAGGNPFFLEELLRAAVAGPDEDAMPETVLAMVQKRLEALSDEVRRFLRAASVFGPVFSRGGAAALLGAPSAALVNGWLGDLVDREVVVRQLEPRVEGEVEYGFAHGLVRDCAYLMLTEGDRKLAHKLAGEWLENVGERDPSVLAEHFERGGETARAAKKYAAAAAEALEADDLESTIRVVTHAIDLAAADEIRGELHLIRAEAYRWRGDFEKARADGADAVRELPVETSAWYRAIAGAIAAGASTGQLADATAFASRLRDAAAGEDKAGYAMALAQSATYLLAAGSREPAETLLGALGALGDVDASPLLVARRALAQSMHAHVIGDAPRAFEEMLRAAEQFERAGDRRSACAARANAGLFDSLMGRLERAERLLNEALAMAERGGALNTVAWIRQSLALPVAYSGRLSEGLALTRQAGDAAHEQRDSRLEAKARITEAEILVELDDAPAAEAAARVALELGEGSAAIRAGALAVLADALRAQGRTADSHDAASAAASLLDRGEALEEAEPAVRLAFAEALMSLRREDEARAAIEAASRAIVAKAARIGDPSDRELFLRCVPVHARTLARARAWGVAGSS
jgi:hypothetical protein